MGREGWKKKRIHEDGGELRVNYRDRAGIFFHFHFCLALSTNIELCVSVSVFITIYVSKNMSFSGEHHRVGLRRCKIHWKPCLPYFFFPSPTVRKPPSSCQTGSQLNSSDVQIGCSPYFQLLKDDAVLGGGKPPLQQGSEGQSHGSHHKASLHSLVYSSTVPIHHQSLGRRTCAVVVSGVSDSACLGFELFCFERPLSDPGEKITLPTRPALSQGNYQGAGKGPTMEWKSTCIIEN